MSKAVSCIYIVCALVFSVSLQASQVTEVKSTAGLCKKATGFSKGLSEYIATRKKISTRSIYLLDAFPTRNNKACYIKFDTPKGPDSCSYTTLYTDGEGNYWVGGVCY